MFPDSNSQQMFEELTQYKKLSSKLEIMLEEKQNEIKMLHKINQDLKEANEAIQKDCDDLNTKLLISYNDIKALEEKHDEEIETLKNDAKKKREVYEEQILKLSSNNPEETKRRITNQIEAKYKITLDHKDMEIEELRKEINQCKKELELLQSEYQTYKSNVTMELNLQKDAHQNELAQMLNKIEYQNIKDTSKFDKETFKEIRTELDNQRKINQTLTLELDNMKKEKENITLEKHELKMNLLKHTDESTYKSKEIIAENERLNIQLNALQNEKDQLSQTLNEKDEYINNITEEKLQYISLCNQKENDIASLELDLANLKNQFDKYLLETGYKLNKYEDEKTFTDNTYKQNEEKYKKTIEDLTEELNQTNNKLSDLNDKYKLDLQAIQKDLELEKEEKINLKSINTNLKDSLDNIQKNYKDLNDNFIVVTKDLNEYKEHNKDLEIGFRKLENKKNNYESDLKYKKKYLYYKTQCQKANKRHELALGLLDSELRQQIYDEWTKYDLIVDQ